jgi:uncharacterized coiled-coil protein SlyX
MEVTKDTVLQLELTIEEINNILAGLQELSAKICNPLTNKIQKQASQQLPEPEAEPTPAAKPAATPAAKK